MKLYSYFNSSAAYRTRIALNLKGVSYEQIPVDLMASAQNRNAYLALNPQGLVPALELEDHTLISQSAAICEYLDEVYPNPPLLPGTPQARGRMRMLMHGIACDIHPIANLRVRQYLQSELGATDAQAGAWIAHWISVGFEAAETILARTAGSRFCMGESVTLADVFLVPQYYNAERFGVDTKPFPTLGAIVERCRKLHAFATAHPDRQPDAP